MDPESKRRGRTVVTWMFGGALVIFAGVLGLWIYMSANAKPLHPDAQAMPSVARASAAPPWTDAIARGREAVRAHVAGKNLPGVAIAVGVNGRVVWEEGFGWADLDKQLKVTPDTQFRLGTASMPLTSAAVGVLLERRKLDLDADIQNYVPEFPRKQWPVTLRELMAHTGGVRSDGGDEGPFRSLTVCEKPVEGLRFFAGEPLLFEPGTRFRRSIYGWILVSAAVEAGADGEPFPAFMRSKVFAPLGMAHTRADANADTIPERATLYFPRFSADPHYGPDVNDPVEYSCYAGASVFLSTAADVARFGMGINGGTLLKVETVQELQTSQRLRSGEETGYGLGWDLKTATIAGAPTPAVGYDGYLMGGNISSLLTLPSSGVTVAVLSNIAYADTRELAERVAGAFAAARPAAVK